jgi:hypothetical protein
MIEYFSSFVHASNRAGTFAHSTDIIKPMLQEIPHTVHPSDPR